MTDEQINAGLASAVENIIKDLSDRRGLKHAWETIDADIQDEIKAEWAGCIGSAIKAAGLAVVPVEPTRELDRSQPCGCIVCECMDDERCHGCGAKHCGTHPVGKIPNPVYRAMIEKAGE